METIDWEIKHLWPRVIFYALSNKHYHVVDWVEKEKNVKMESIDWKDRISDTINSSSQFSQKFTAEQKIAINGAITQFKDYQLARLTIGIQHWQTPDEFLHENVASISLNDN